MKKIVVILGLAGFFSWVACNDIYCPAGISKSCSNSCADKKSASLTECWRLYGPDGAADDIALDACRTTAEVNYNDCYDDCPCEGEVDPDVDVKACN